MSILLHEKNAQTGIETKVHGVDGKVVIEKSYDAQPLLDDAAERRAVTAGQRWGDMRHVGFIPMAELATMMRRDGTLDQASVMAWLKKNPALVTFDKFLKK